MKSGSFCMHVASLLAITCVLFVSCERDGADDDDVFRIEPGDATLRGDGATVVLSVVGGIHPYEWRVTDETLGAVTGGGVTVTYTRSAANGANIVEVRDSRQWLASAVITQQDEEEEQDEENLDLTVSQSAATLSADGDKIVLSASGGEPSYLWIVMDLSLGHFEGPVTGESVVYVRDAAGESAIQVQDRGGDAKNIIVSQPAS